MSEADGPSACPACQPAMLLALIGLLFPHAPRRSDPLALAVSTGVLTPGAEFRSMLPQAADLRAALKALGPRRVGTYVQLQVRQTDRQ